MSQVNNTPQVLNLKFFFLLDRSIGLAVRVFNNGSGDWGSIPGRVIPKTQKMMPPCLTLSIIRYGSRVKWSNPRKGVALSSTPRCCSYWKGSLRVTFDYYFLLAHYFILVRWKRDGWIYFPKGITTVKHKLPSPEFELVSLSLYSLTRITITQHSLYKICPASHTIWVLFLAVSISPHIVDTMI